MRSPMGNENILFFSCASVLSPLSLTLRRITVLRMETSWNANRSRVPQLTAGWREQPLSLHISIGVPWNPYMPLKLSDKLPLLGAQQL